MPINEPRDLKGQTPAGLGYGLPRRNPALLTRRKPALSYPICGGITANYYKREAMLERAKPTSEDFTNRFFEACNSFDRSAVVTTAEEFRPS